MSPASADGSTDSVFSLSYLSGPATMNHVRLTIPDRACADFRRQGGAGKAAVLSPSHELWRLAPGASADLNVRLWRRKGTLPVTVEATAGTESWTSTVSVPFHVLV